MKIACVGAGYVVRPLTAQGGLGLGGPSHSFRQQHRSPLTAFEPAASQSQTPLMPFLTAWTALRHRLNHSVGAAHQFSPKQPLSWHACLQGGPTMAMIAAKCPDIDVVVLDINESRIAGVNGVGSALCSCSGAAPHCCSCACSVEQQHAANIRAGAVRDCQARAGQGQPAVQHGRAQARGRGRHHLRQVSPGLLLCCCF